MLCPGALKASSCVLIIRVTLHMYVSRNRFKLSPPGLAFAKVNHLIPEGPAFRCTRPRHGRSHAWILALPRLNVTLSRVSGRDPEDSIFPGPTEEFSRLS